MVADHYNTVLTDSHLQIESRVGSGENKKGWEGKYKRDIHNISLSLCTASSLIMCITIKFCDILAIVFQFIYLEAFHFRNNTFVFKNDEKQYIIVVQSSRLPEFESQFRHLLV